MIGYRILSPAKEEAAEAAEYYNSFEPGLGLEFFEQFETHQAFTRLSFHRHAHQKKASCITPQEISILRYLLFRWRRAGRHSGSPSKPASWLLAIKDLLDRFQFDQCRIIPALLIRPLLTAITDMDRSPDSA